MGNLCSSGTKKEQKELQESVQELKITEELSSVKAEDSLTSVDKSNEGVKEFVESLDKSMSEQKVEESSQSDQTNEKESEEAQTEHDPLLEPIDESERNWFDISQILFKLAELISVNTESHMMSDEDLNSFKYLIDILKSTMDLIQKQEISTLLPYPRLRKGAVKKEGHQMWSNLLYLFNASSEFYNTRDPNTWSQIYQCFQIIVGDVYCYYYAHEEPYEQDFQELQQQLAESFENLKDDKYLRSVTNNDEMKNMSLGCLLLSYKSLTKATKKQSISLQLELSTNTTSFIKTATHLKYSHSKLVKHLDDNEARTKTKKLVKSLAKKSDTLFGLVNQLRQEAVPTIYPEDEITLKDCYESNLVEYDTLMGQFNKRYHGKSKLVTLGKDVFLAVSQVKKYFGTDELDLIRTATNGLGEAVKKLSWHIFNVALEPENREIRDIMLISSQNALNHCMKIYFFTGFVFMGDALVLLDVSYLNACNGILSALLVQLSYATELQKEIEEPSKSEINNAMCHILKYGKPTEPFVDPQIQQISPQQIPPQQITPQLVQHLVTPVAVPVIEGNNIIYTEKDVDNLLDDFDDMFQESGRENNSENAEHAEQQSNENSSEEHQDEPQSTVPNLSELSPEDRKAAMHRIMEQARKDKEEKARIEKLNAIVDNQSESVEN